MSSSLIKRFGRKCQTCGVRRRSVCTRTVEQYPTGKQYESKNGDVHVVASTRAMVCDGCEDESQ
jgi:hypothetical protein